jgi:hypothetical protein
MAIDFRSKDPWGYHFAQPMMRLDRGVAEVIRRDPNDKERERICRVLEQQYELDARDLDQGLEPRLLPWRRMERERSSPRKRLAEAIKKHAHRAPGGRLGIAQVHALAHEALLLHTWRARAEKVGFPLELAIDQPALGTRYAVDYVLHVDRAFYSVFVEPRKDRFAPPLLVSEALRVFEGRAEARVRKLDKSVWLAASSQGFGRPLVLEIEIDADRFRYKEQLGPHPSGQILDAAEQPVGSLSSEKVSGFDMTLRVDVCGPTEPWLGLLSILADAWTQRVRGTAERALEHDAERQQAAAEADDDDPED